MTTTLAYEEIREFVESIGGSMVFSAGSGPAYVVSTLAEERDAPHELARVISRCHRGQALTVHELKGGWAHFGGLTCLDPDAF